MTARRAGALLRAPPFPAIDPATSCLVRGGADASAVDPGLMAETVAAMVRARVGGNFWGRQLAANGTLTVRSKSMPVSSAGGTVAVRSGDGGLAAERVAAGDVDPWSLVETAHSVVAPARHEIALLALAAGKPVAEADGTPIDEKSAGLASALFGKAYRDPFNGRAVDAMATILRLEGWRRLIDANRGLSAATGMAFWKRREVARVLWDGRRGTVPFLRPDAAIARARREGGAVAAWPARVPADFAERAASAGVPVRWVEDGFLRSAGLGSDLLPPLSLVVDDLWPYFDPAQPSRLETLLQAGGFGEDVIARAAALRAIIVERRIGKYRIGGGEPVNLPPIGRVVLVVGQVEDDLSILRGGFGMTNLALIERARAAEPDAFLVYRPHPDVEAGHRRGAISDSAARRHVDRVDRGGSLDATLGRVAAVHTITSLTGFEALMRGVDVVVYGAPFYAGWGLTDDRGPALPRRTRRLSIDELVAGALIVYPRYLDARTGLPCTPEEFIEGLGGVGVHARFLVRVRRWQGRLRRLLG